MLPLLHCPCCPLAWFAADASGAELGAAAVCTAAIEATDAMLARTLAHARHPRAHTHHLLASPSPHTTHYQSTHHTPHIHELASPTSAAILSSSPHPHTRHGRLDALSRRRTRNTTQRNTTQHNSQHNTTQHNHTHTHMHRITAPRVRGLPAAYAEACVSQHTATREGNLYASGPVQCLCIATAWPEICVSEHNHYTASNLMAFT